MSPRDSAGRRRPRRRYVRALVQCQGSPATREELAEAIRESVRETFGLTGLGNISPKLVFYDRARGVVIVRCTHSTVAELCTALALINRVKSGAVSLNPETVSGLMRSLRKKQQTTLTPREGAPKLNNR